MDKGYISCVSFYPEAGGRVLVKFERFDGVKFEKMYSTRKGAEIAKTAFHNSSNRLYWNICSRVYWEVCDNEKC